MNIDELKGDVANPEAVQREKELEDLLQRNKTYKKLPTLDSYGDMVQGDTKISSFSR